MLSNNLNHPIVYLIKDNLIRSNIEISLSWIPSHIGIDGNEKADYWAKKSLDYNIITSVPMTVKTFKSIAIKRIMTFWHTQWTEENLENKIRKDLNRFETEERKSRREEIVLCRLRTKKIVMTD